MPNTFKVSVIIPVYNAEPYLRKAISSAVHLESVGEIILVEDASPDNALALAKELEKEFDKVKLFQHPDKGNHGAGASRNFGIKKATCDYIAFLDADDYYLPERFKQDAVVFTNYPDADGVYSCVGTHFYDENARKQFFDKGLGYQETLSLSTAAEPDDLFKVLFHSHPKIKGEFCTDGITLKKSVFDKVGYFNTQLRLRQDIHLWKRLAGFCRLYAGQIESPAAMRGIHAQNRMTQLQDHDQYQRLWWRSLREEFKAKGLESSKYAIFEQAYFNYFTDSTNKFTAFKALLMNCIKYPNIIKHSYQHFDFNVFKVFGRNWVTLHFISFKNKIFSKTAASKAQ